MLRTCSSLWMAAVPCRPVVAEIEQHQGQAIDKGVEKDEQQHQQKGQVIPGQQGQEAEVGQGAGQFQQAEHHAHHKEGEGVQLGGLFGAVRLCLGSGSGQREPAGADDEAQADGQAPQPQQQGRAIQLGGPVAGGPIQQAGQLGGDAVVDGQAQQGVGQESAHGKEPGIALFAGGSEQQHILGDGGGVQAVKKTGGQGGADQKPHSSPPCRCCGRGLGVQPKKGRKKRLGPSLLQRPTEGGKAFTRR